MFTLEETTTWTADDVFARIRLSLPLEWEWELTRDFQSGWLSAAIKDTEGKTQWLGEHTDAKILFLDALGWLRLRDHKIKHPVWKPRDQEVPLYRPPVPVTTNIPDPPDLGPDEVDAVYKTSR